ncbi:MAG: T9SS type A sorting domain-containing protein [Chlorobi bacterium]|nr:MAG: FG-GAP repeat protein [Chlorobi bacterium OLB7]MBK8910864.1 T9SS type A sorting domain-containing protein [Chlorobiota bacterium]MBX7216132.1 T9SS type A sorting domain-containing protein [Candidatus Kapabacteria bacterium]
MNTKTTIVLLLLLATASPLLHAQASDTIIPNPNAVLLRKIWMIRGETTGPNAGGMVGDGAAAIPDVTGDSLDDFLIHFGKSPLWKLFPSNKPAPDTTPIWQTIGFSTSPLTPGIGSFWGDSRKMLWIARDTCDTNQICFLRLLLFPLSKGTIADTPAFILNTHIQFCPRDVFARDLDNDGDDELILTRSCSYPEIWIYEGGPNFTTTAPTMKIGDENDNGGGLSNHSTVIADVDGDRRLDMVTGAGYGGNPKLKIWYGRDGSPWNWNSTPDRVIPSLPGFPWFSNGITSLDSDGDSIADILVNGNYLFRSASGKNFRSRSFQVDDADQQLQSPDFFVRFNAGPLNNSNHRFDMIALVRPGQDRFASSELRLFSGGPAGVNTTYDAFYSTHSDGMIAGNSFQHVVPLADCNGDGWSDLLVADPNWWGFDQGIAIILAGGPYIPNDDPSVDVQQLPAEGKSNAISLWPNPVRDQLNIAWHGGLNLPPARIAIHDLTGRLVASGTTDPSVGAAVWHADAVADGTYFLTLYDRNGAAIASKLFNKQR